MQHHNSGDGMGLAELNRARKKLGHAPLRWKPAGPGPTTSSAVRVARHRARRARGKVLLHIEIDELAVTEVLARAQLLDSLQDHGRDDLGRAVERLLELLARDA
jgi:hypothetical protein